MKPDVDISRLQSMWEAKVSVERIAKELGVSMDAIKALRLPKRPNVGGFVQWNTGQTVKELRHKEAEWKKHPQPVTEDVRRLMEKFA